MTDKELGNVLKGVTIIADTREKKNQHILDYFESNEITYKVDKLDFGDYSFELPEPYSHLNYKVSVEKKNSIDEINGNFTKGRERFHNEFKRATDCGLKLHLVIENATWKKIANGSYRSGISPKSLTASLLTFNRMYDSPVWFVGKDESPMLIYHILYYGIRGLLKSE